ncbi:hypothetical protein cypCar_00000955 [Cyprinus carpio]|nr:hypothetical protein cypCar_00000955 [Cyprinus carpio]
MNKHISVQYEDYEKMQLKEIPVDGIIRPLGLIFCLTAFGAVIYFTIKWMADAIDPTRKQKAKAQKQAEKLMQEIGVKKMKLSEYDMSTAAHLVDPLTMQVTIIGATNKPQDLYSTILRGMHKIPHQSVCECKKMVLKEIPTDNFTRPLGRNEVIGLLFRLTIFGAVTYFTIKWMVDAIDPTRKQKVEAQKQITWHDIAGLDEVITELKDTVILPIQKRHLFEGSRLLQPPKGVLLYGPPGCGKTLIAKATAKEAGFRFINLQPSTLTDKWYGESQKLAAAVFSLAIKLQPSIIFIDEIDSFLRSRSSSDHEATAMMKAQFMSLWDGLDTDYNCQVIIMGATNRPQDLDSAILRRMPTRFHVNQPNVKQRNDILKLILKNENVETAVDFGEIAKQTDGFSGSDLREMCRDAALLCVRDFVHQESPDEDFIRPIRHEDLQRAIGKMRKSKSAGMQEAFMHVPLD